MAKYVRAKKDVNLELTNQLIEMAMSENSLPWQRDWKLIKGLSPFNFDHGTVYKGFYNQLVLAMKANGRIPAFAMYNKELHTTKKGSKGVKIMKPIMFKGENKVTGAEEFKFGGVSYITVFHYTDLQMKDEEVLKLESKYTPKSDGNTLAFNPIAECEFVIASMPNCPTIDNNGGNSAYYRPSTDTISMPKKSQFKSEAGYYLTLFHELGHSTGHFTRLDRFKKNKEEFKSSHKEEYSYEELVAEMTACFLGTHCDIMSDTLLDNSASYLKSWVSKLQSNPDWIVKASGQATKAMEAIAPNMMQGAEAVAA